MMANACKPNSSLIGEIDGMKRLSIILVPSLSEGATVGYRLDGSVTFRPLASSTGTFAKLFDRTCTSDLNGAFRVSTDGGVSDFVAVGHLCKVPVLITPELLDKVSSLFNTVGNFLGNFRRATGI